MRGRKKRIKNLLHFSVFFVVFPLFAHCTQSHTDPCIYIFDMYRHTYCIECLCSLTSVDISKSSPRVYSTSEAYCSPSSKRSEITPTSWSYKVYTRQQQYAHVWWSDRGGQSWCHTALPLAERQKRISRWIKFHQICARGDHTTLVK